MTINLCDMGNLHRTASVHLPIGRWMRPKEKGWGRYGGNPP